jgi:transposase-like protein
MMTHAEVTGVVRRPSFIKDWVEKKVRRHMLRAMRRRGDAEAIAPGAVLADVARRHDPAPQHLSN